MARFRLPSLKKSLELLKTLNAPWQALFEPFNPAQVVPPGVGVTCAIQTLPSGLIQVTATVRGLIQSFFSLDISGFFNPTSTAETDSFEIRTYAPNSNTVLDEQLDSILLSATRGSLKSVTLSPSSQIVGDSSSDLTVTLRTANTIPQNGKIKVTFPYWNPQAQGTIYKTYPYTQLSNLQCMAKSSVPMRQGSQIPCTFDSGTNTVTLSNVFTSVVAGDTELVFLIKQVKNPVSTQGVTDIQVYTVDDTAKQGIIDWSYGFLQVSSPGKIMTSSVKPDSTLVQDLTQYRIEFMVPVPLTSGCIIEIVFPPQITLDAELQNVQSFGMPNAQRRLSGSIDRNRNSFVITNGCPSYRDNTNSAIILFQKIRNPFYLVQTDPIEILISDSGQRLVCTTAGTGPRVTTTSGNIKVNPLVAEVTTEINQVTTVQFGIQPTHELSADSQIIIKLPSEFQLVPASSSSSFTPTCQYTGISDNMIRLIQDCQYSIIGGVKQIVISKAFTRDYTFNPNSYVQFKIHNIKLPPSEAPTGSFQIQVATNVNGAYLVVDQAIVSNLFQATRAALGYTNVNSDSQMTGQLSTYSFEINVNNPLLQGGSIVVKFPPEVLLQTNQARCQDFSASFQNTPICSFTQDSISLKNGFISADFTNDKGALTFKVFGILNPRSLKASGSFAIYTYDSKGYMIEFKSDQMTIHMSQVNKIQQALVQSSLSTVGQLASYLFTFRSSTGLINGDVISITFPNDYSSTPIVNSLQSCTPSSGTAGGISCKNNGPFQILVTLALTTQQTTSAIQFNVNYVYNPPSTEPTSLFQAQIQDQSGALVSSNNPDLSTFFIKMTQGAQIKNISVVNQNRRPFIMTAFTFTFVVDIRIPPNAKIVVKYPPQITANPIYTGCQLSNKNPDTACDFDTDKQQVVITAVTSTNIEAGTIFQVTLYGLINSKLAAPTDSFQILVQTGAGNEIMSSKTGLKVTTDCDYPCLTCQAGAPSKCTTCDSTSQFGLFLNNQCLTKCPSNYYPSEYQCLKCDANCMECADGGSKCLKCYKGTYLQGNTCVKRCLADVEIQNEAALTCDACKSPCDTCSNTVTNCTSCMQIEKEKFFYQNKCLQTCPADITVAQNASCVNCNPNCKTCTGLPSVCTSCNGQQKLDTADSLCKDSCPLGTSVEQGNKCYPCDTTCKTCASTDRQYCLSCEYGLNFYESKHQCIVKCPNRTVQITWNSVPYCRDCNQGCMECQNKTDYCTKCDPDHVFFKFTCIKYNCPTGYRRISAERNICVLEREDCPYGYDYNDYGECSLVAQKCEPGYILNKGLNRCIPVPGFYIPLLFLGLAFLYTIYALVMYKKGKILDKFTLLSQLLTVYTMIQTITYFIMFCLSIELDYDLVTSIHLICLFSMMLANLGFTLIMHLKLRKDDQAFKYWTDENIKPYRIIKWLMFLYSFKAVRLLYSQIQNKPYFDAPFERKYQTLIKPLFFVTVINFLLQAGPIILMDCYNLWFIGWGYQIQVMSIDNMILACVIFVLEVIEFTHYKKLAIEEGNLIYNGGAAGKKFLKVRNEHMVMSGVGGGGDYDEGDGSLMYLNHNISAAVGNGLSQKELHSIESMYMTKQGLNKKLNAQRKESLDSYRMGVGGKFVDPDQIYIGNMQTGGALNKRLSHVVTRDQETRLLENIVKRLAEEEKFNHLQSEPATNNEELSLIDNETRALIGNTASKATLPTFVKQKVKVETTRERIENHLSFRSNNPKTRDQLMHERVVKELNKAVYEGRPPMAPPQTRQRLSVGLSKATEEAEDTRTYQLTQAKEEEGRNRQATLINLESARTEKFNRYSPGGARPRSTNVAFSQVEKEVTKTPPRKHSAKVSAYAAGASSPSRKSVAESIYGLNDRERLIERDKRDYAYYYKDFKNILKAEVRAKEPNIRAWQSFDGDVLREWYDDMECESDFEYNVSIESYPHGPQKLKNAEYLARLELFRQNIKPKHQFDNVYTQQNDPSLLQLKREGQKNVTRRTQTYERDIAIGYDPFDREGDLILTEEDRAIEYDPDFAKNLVMNLIDNLSDFPSSTDPAKESDQQPRRVGRRITRENFDLDDILGSFDIDDHGNLILNPEVLLDNLGRKVNKHGYLVDEKGNILNQDGDLMFSFVELDEDGDLPHPYRFEKRRKHLLKQKDIKFGMTVEGAEARRLFDIDSVMMNEDEQVEEEFQKLRDLSRPSSVDSLMGQGPLNHNSIDDQIPLVEDQEQFEVKSAADRRALQMAQAYGGKPPAQKKKTKKKKKANNRRQPNFLDERPPTDRLFPGLMQQEEERVKKIAKVAYRQQNEDNGDTADGLGFQQFFKKQMDEIHQNRQIAKEELRKSQILYGQLSEEPELAENLPKFDRNLDHGFESEQTLGHNVNGPATINQQTSLQLRDSSISTNRGGAPGWVAGTTTNLQLEPHIASGSPLSKHLNATNATQSIPELDEEGENKNIDMTSSVVVVQNEGGIGGVDEDAETMDGGRERTSMIDRDNIFRLADAPNAHKQSASFMSNNQFQNLQFNNQMTSSALNLSSNGSPQNQHQKQNMNSSQSNLNPFTSHSLFYHGGVTGGAPASTQQQAFRDMNTTLSNASSHATGFYRAPLPQQQQRNFNQRQLHSDNNELGSGGFFNQTKPTADQSETIDFQQPKNPFRKFDFYLPDQKGSKKNKKNLERRDLNFSDVGYMQMTGGHQSNNSNNRIKDMERLYLKKQHGHLLGVANMPSKQGGVQHFNSYVNNQDQRQPQYASSTGHVPPVQPGPTKRRPVGQSVMRLGQGSQDNLVMNQTYSSFNQQHNQQAPNGQSSMLAVVQERPLSSLTNMHKNAHLNRLAGGVKLNTVNSEGADVFDGIARVLDNIDRLKSSGGGLGGDVAASSSVVNFYQQNVPAKNMSVDMMETNEGDTSSMMRMKDTQVLSNASTDAKYYIQNY